MSANISDAKQIFFDARDIADPADRRQFVLARCAGDSSLQARVESLLTADQQSGGILDQSFNRLLPTDIGPQIPETVGTLIGPYKLMEQIGEGGFGLVFVAEQHQPVRRKVALKIIKPGMNTREVVARFEAERQALALMEHPNIARVLDAGATPSGLPYFVMELVRGIPITDYCDRNQLATRDRLELFMAVCRAVQHAHQKGIIHRDIKPSNVLVTAHDGAPVVKLIDFGVAKALHQPLTDKTIYTRFAQLIGTPLYTSPEQAEMTGLDIDTRSDIYSLGVLLYELLTGSTPLLRERLATVAYQELVRIIREEEPPKPSTRLTQSSATITSVAAHRKLEPHKLSKLLEGDLDWITMKALEKDRTRRYDSAGGLAADVLRYLQDEPVDACPPSQVYRLRKFARKHRGPVIAGGAIMALLVIGIAGTTWGMLRARQAEQAASDAERQAVQERDAKQLALRQVTDERNAKDVALVTVAQERDRAGRHIIQALISPIGHSEGEFDAIEWKTFVEWSTLDDSKLKLGALEAALAEPEIALRVARRAEFVIQACVGLSPIRHAQALELVSATQRDLNADPRSRIAACWLALVLGSTDLPALEESVLWLGVYHNDHDKQFPEFLDSVVRCHDPDQQAAIASSLPHAIITHMQRGYQHDYEFPAETFTWLRESLTDSQIEDARTALTPLMESNLFGVQEEGIQGLGLLAPRFSPQQASETITQLIRCIETARDDSVAWRAADALGPMAARTDAAAFEQVWLKLNRLLRDPAWTEDGRGLAPCARSMRQMLPRLSGSQIVEGLSALVTCIAAPPSGEISEVDDFCDALHALGMRLQDSDVAPLADAVVAHAQRATTLSGKIAALSAIETLAARIDSDRAAACWDIAIALLDWDKVKNQPQTCLEALAPRMDEAACGARWRSLVDNVTTARATESISATVTGLRILAPRLSEADKAASAGQILQHLEQPQEQTVRALLLEGLAPLSASLSDADVIRCGELLNPEFAGNLDSRTFPAVIRVFSALVARWSDAQIETVRMTVFEVLAEGYPYEVYNAAYAAIVALAPRLNEQASEELWRQWIAYCEKNKESNWSEQFDRAEDAVWRRLADLGGKTALADVQTLLESSSESDVRHLAASRLVDIAPQLSEPELARVCQCLLDALAREESPMIATMLVELFPLVSPSEATRMTNAAATIALDRNAAGAGYPFFEVWRFDRNVGYVSDVCDVTLFVSPESKWLDPRSLARFLSHPGCTEEVRQRLLQRFEEVVLHDGQQVFLKPKPEADAPGDTVVPVPPRRFHDLHDVAVWIQATWPDFDLETNCPATWRP